MPDERFITIDLTGAYMHTRTKRTDRAVKILRASVARHCKAAVEDVRLSEKLNATLWQHSRQRPPRRIRVKVETKDGRVNARLHDEKVEEKKPETKKGAGEKPEAKKDVVKPTATGTKEKPAEPAGKKTEAAPKAQPAPPVHKHEAEKILDEEKKRENRPHERGEHDKR